MTEPWLILDLDETLIYGTERPLTRPAELNVGAYSIYTRPHLAEFIDNIRSDYRVAVWTSATRSYAEPIVSFVFPPDMGLEFLWCRERCTWRQDLDSREGYWLMNLKKLKRLGLDLDRVLFVDDTVRNSERNYSNHIGIKPYRGEPEDRELVLLEKYLASVAPLRNLRSLEKRRWREETLGQGVG